MDVLFFKYTVLTPVPLTFKVIVDAVFPYKNLTAILAPDFNAKPAQETTLSAVAAAVEQVPYCGFCAPLPTLSSTYFLVAGW